MEKICKNGGKYYITYVVTLIIGNQWEWKSVRINFEISNGNSSKQKGQ